jgi:hypothetical protein
VDGLGEQLEGQRGYQRAAGEGEQHAADLLRGPPQSADDAADDQRTGPDQPEHQCLSHLRQPPPSLSAAPGGAH